MNWDDVRYFLALARTRSVRAAGASLGVSHSTIARRVETLESSLGVKLFDRNRDGYLLTDAGREMVTGAERVEREVGALERGLVGQDARLEGAVRVTCTDPYIAKILLRALAELCELHPGIELQLDADARNVDLSKREADIALRALLTRATPRRTSDGTPARADRGRELRLSRTHRAARPRARGNAGPLARLGSGPRNRIAGRQLELSGAPTPDANFSHPACFVNCACNN